MSPPLTNATLLGTPGVLGVYNFTMADCSNFRNDSSKQYFRVWPEDHLTYCCEDATDHKYSLTNFTYSIHGARLISRPYFDLGYVDFELSPYWKQYRFWRVPQRKIILEGFNCEYTDLHHLYNHRFWTKVMRDATIAAAWFILILQTIVVLFVLVKWCIHLCTPSRKRSKLEVRSSLRRWWWTKLKLEDWVSDLAHLSLIVIVGSCLIEAVGHSSPTRWRAIIFYNSAVVYAWLTLLCLIASALRQLAVSSFDESVDETKRKERIQLRLEKEIKTYLERKEPVPQNLLETIQKKKDLSLSKISEDWRWQRVFGQLAVLILVGTYLSFVDDDSGSAMDNIAALLFAALVVACMWSGGVGLVVTGRTLSHIFRHFMRLPELSKEDRIALQKIRYENSITEVSQTFYPVHNIYNQQHPYYYESYPNQAQRNQQPNDYEAAPPLYEPVRGRH